VSTFGVVTGPIPPPLGGSQRRIAAVSIEAVTKMALKKLRAGDGNIASKRFAQQWRLPSRRDGRAGHLQFVHKLPALARRERAVAGEAGSPESLEHCHFRVRCRSC
jgi:hypothetical protein